MGKTAKDDRDAEIVRLYVEGGRTFTDLGREYDLHPGSVSNIIRDRIGTVVPSVINQAHAMDDRSDVEAAYLAGLIDSDGHIGLGRSVRVAVTNTDREWMEWLAETWDGTLYPNTPGRPNRDKPQWIVRWNGRYSLPLLTRVRPWLRAKAAQADLAIHWLTHLRGRKGMPVSDEIQRAREVIHDDMTTLNRKGAA